MLKLIVVFIILLGFSNSLTAQVLNLKMGSKLVYKIDYNEPKSADTATKTLTIDMLVKEYGVNRVLSWVNNGTNYKGILKVTTEKWKNGNAFIMDDLFTEDAPSKKKLANSTGIWMSDKDFTLLKKSKKYTFKINKPAKGELSKIVYMATPVKYNISIQGIATEVDAIEMTANNVGGLFNSKIIILDNKANPMVLSSVLELINGATTTIFSNMQLQTVD
jgi:hypothetical protein